MNLEQLSYFDAVCKQGSISKAAANLFISQSTVSTAISHLEKELQVTLLKRSKNGVTMTAQGEVVLGYVRRALGELNDLKAYAKSSQKVMEGAIYLASAPSFSQCVLTGVLGRLLLEAPEIQLYVQEKLHLQIIEELCEGKIDLGIVGYFQEEAAEVKWQCAKHAIVLQELCRSRNYLYCRANHPLLEAGTAVDEALMEYPLLICRHMHQAAIDVFTGGQIIREVDNYAQIKAIIDQSDFVALLPEMFEQCALAGDEPIVRLASAASVPESQYSWVKLASNLLLPAEQKVLELIAEQLICTGEKRGEGSDE